MKERHGYGFGANHSSEVRVFISYTTHENEVQAILPLVDAYEHELRALANRLGVEIFLDRWSLRYQRWPGEEWTRDRLADAIGNAALFTAFLSPGYEDSIWCGFELGMALRLRRANPDVPLIHAIYWKPELSFLRGEGPLTHLSEYRLDDVTYAYREPRRIGEAAQQCARNSWHLIESLRRR